MKKPEVTIPTIIGLLIAVGGLVAGLWLIRGQLKQSGKAAADEVPEEVKITNINDTSFTVSWVTGKAVSGYVRYTETGGEPETVMSDERDLQRGSVENYFTHFVTVRGLKPETVYDFEVGSGKNLYDQEGELYQTETAPSLAMAPDADVAYGKASTANGDPAEGTIVYYQLPNCVLQAGLVKSSGSWVVPVSTARAEDLSGYAEYDPIQTRIRIEFQGGPMGTAAVDAVTRNDSPVGDVVLGNSYAFLTPGNKPSPTPTAVPEPVEPAPGGLLISAPKSGEKINSFRPEIIGKAPPGTEITVEIHSDAVVSGISVADNEGNYSFSVPTDLAPGEHTVTVSAVVDGVVQKVSKGFVVYAAGESFLPAFSATPSATTVPSPLPSVRISPSVTPRVSPTIKPTAGATTVPTIKPTIWPTPTATDSGLPESGSASGTWIILLAGLALMLFGVFGFRKSAIKSE